MKYTVSINTINSTHQYYPRPAVRRSRLFPLRDLDREQRRLNHKDASPPIRQYGEEDHLPGIINVRSDGETIYTARRVNTGYQWESYGPITPVN